MSKDEYPFFSPNPNPTFEDWLALKHREIDASRPDASLVNIVKADRGWRYDSRR